MKRQPRVETFSAGFTLSESDTASGTFSGYASVFGSTVETWSGPAVIERGAFSKTLAEAGKRVRLLWQHDQREPIGIPIELREDERGLWLRGRISDTVRGRDALTLMRDGVVSEMSIGFDPIKESSKDDMRHIHEVRLWEVSPVTFAADPQAQIGEVHSRDLYRQFCAWLAQSQSAAPVGPQVAPTAEQPLPLDPPQPAAVEPEHRPDSWGLQLTLAELAMAEAALILGTRGRK